MAPGKRAARKARRSRKKLCGELLFVCLVGCGSHGSVVPAQGPLEGGDVARVDDAVISKGAVEWVARGQRCTPREALAEVVQDALLARSARDQGLDQSADVSWATAVALARRIPAAELASAQSAGPPSDDEIQTVTVVRALVTRSAVISPLTAASVAASIRQASEGSTTADDFKRRASAVPTVGARVVFASLGAFSADGIVEGRRIAPPLVAAAFALHPLSSTSPVIETTEGWSVLHLVERALPDARTQEERRSDLADTIVAMRAFVTGDALLRALRTRGDVRIAANAEDLMSNAIPDGP